MCCQISIMRKCMDGAGHSLGNSARPLQGEGKGDRAWRACVLACLGINGLVMLLGLDAVADYDITDEEGVDRDQRAVPKSL